MSALYWREPAWALLGLLPLLLVLVSMLRQRRQWHRFADPALLPWLRVQRQPGQQRLTRLLLVLGWMLLCIALAGPRTALRVPPELRPADSAVVAIIDLSASMRTQDVRPDRLGQAQAWLQQWLQLAPETLKVGLQVYAGHAHSILIPTTDHALVQHYVDQLQALRPPTMGNNLAAALDQAGRNLRQPKSSQGQGQGENTTVTQQQGRKHVLLFSDGDLGSDARADAERVLKGQLTDSNIRLQVIGIGGPEPMTVPADGSRPLLIDGKPVLSRRDSGWLIKLATLGQGDYRQAEDLTAAMLGRLIALPRQRIDPSNSSGVLWQEWFPLPLLVGLLLIIFSHAYHNRQRPGFTIGLLFVVGALTNSSDSMASADNAGEALARGDYARAQQLASQQEGYRARFIEGNACFRQQDYACAQRSFSQAAWSAGDDRQRARAVFNLGNTHFHLADYAQASVLFDDAEKLGIDAKLTRINREFADSLAAAVERQLADIAETERRANRRAAAGENAPAGDDLRVSGNLYLARPRQGSAGWHAISADALRALIEKGIYRKQNNPVHNGSTRSRGWVRTPKSLAAGSSASLFNQLMPMEIGIPVAPERPYRLEGKRPW